jgi:hypothetical protein
MKRLIVLLLLAFALAPLTASAAPRAASDTEEFQVAGQIIFAPIMDENGQIQYQVLTPLKGNTKCLVSILATEQYTTPQGAPTTYYLDAAGLAFLEVEIDRPCYPETVPGASSERGHTHASFQGWLMDKDGNRVRQVSFNEVHTFKVDTKQVFTGRTDILSGSSDGKAMGGVLFTRSGPADQYDNYTGRVKFEK